MTKSSRKSIIAGLILSGALSTLSIACGGDDDKKDTSYKEIAPLSAGMEVPAPMGTTTASGVFAFDLDENTGVMKYTLTAADLTGPATAAHIHMGASGVAGPVVLPLTVPTSGVDPVSGTVTLTPAALTDLNAGSLYVNVHTAANPMGEIRGQLKAHK